MGVTAATITVAPPLQVETQAKVAAIISVQDVESLFIHRINGPTDPKPWTNLQVWVRPRFLFCRLLLALVRLRQGGGRGVTVALGAAVAAVPLVHLVVWWSVLAEQAPLAGMRAQVGSYPL